MTALPASLRRPFAAGWCGKIPSAGDFVARRVPAAFTEAWDRWLQVVLEGSRERLGARWREEFLSMPVWRFVFSPRLVTGDAWAGVLLPSVDAVGRYFPLTIVAPLPVAGIDPVATVFAARTWFADIEQIGLFALAPGSEAAAVDARIATRPFLADWLRYRRSTDGTPAASPAQRVWIHLGERTEADLSALPQINEPCAAWLAEPSDVFGRSLLLCNELPPAEQLCAMMNGHPAEHGWTARRALPVS